ncbi:NAD-dependent epimerase/dehydratase family protein [Pedobacter paludis]|uniref:NAD(P)-dependent oxidoreductase n=1 Tax=Pedobacter paludis TaxID=2203212 RepID=A0A317F2F5_9SPHI|nr:NAD-dependent epimerase/dehydratase family protein [Pedobacter paludis]PWS32995.1 NAD(P)-dependent oxidoreductase [Pedobacter paludis]
MHKVLITGITGFLGSRIAENLITNNIQVVGLKRTESNTWRCADFYDNIDWIDLDENRAWKQNILDHNPSVIIHCAWIGVEADDRDNWQMQSQNISFMIALLEIARNVKLQKFIFLGSQAEYGVVDGKITETAATNATSAYGSIKLASLEIMKTFCEINQINWIWLRIFSIFGEKENHNWLIPSIVRKMQTDSQMDFTMGKQKYAYLYVKDFAKIIYEIVINSIQSGIYNISSEQAIELRTLIDKIKEYINPDFKLNYGAIPYRPHQSMHIEGDITKIKGQLGRIDFTDFNVALQHTLNNYLKK